jgi:hypothetical protein
MAAAEEAGHLQGHPVVPLYSPEDEAIGLHLHVVERSLVRDEIGPILLRYETKRAIELVRQGLAPQHLFVLSKVDHQDIRVRLTPDYTPFPSDHAAWRASGIFANRPLELAAGIKEGVDVLRLDRRVSVDACHNVTRSSNTCDSSADLDFGATSKRHRTPNHSRSDQPWVNLGTIDPMRNK